MNLKNRINRRSQTQKPHNVQFNLHELSRTGNPQGQKADWCVPEAASSGKQGLSV